MHILLVEDNPVAAKSIELKLVAEGHNVFVTDLGGNIWAAALDGSGHRPIRSLQGNLTGIAYVELPDEDPS